MTIHIPVFPKRWICYTVQAAPRESNMAKSADFVWHSIIIGGGAAGLFCAASYRTPKLLLEHNPRTGLKVSVSGGGKCNFSNTSVSERNYIGRHKHFAQPALAAWKPQDFIRLLEEEHIPFEEKENGQLFARSAPEIAALLERRARQNNTDIRCNSEVLQVSTENHLFHIQTSQGILRAAHIVIATGGLSYPELGASGFAFRTARELGLQCTTLRPALVGLRAAANWRGIFRQLAGISLEAEIRIGKHKERGPILFTHEGISGPAILQSSLYWREGESIQINFLPVLDVRKFLQENKNQPVCFSKLLSAHINVKAVKALLAEYDVRACDAKRNTLQEAAQRLNYFSFTPISTAGYTRAEVTAGGVDTAQFCPHTLECKTLPGLFYIGEALDVTGRLGGYNLHWAWASAAAAARALAKQ